MYDRILVRFGDLTIKGKNKKYFVQAINQTIKEKCQGLNVDYDFNHDRVYIILNDVPYLEVVKRLNYVCGLYSYSLISRCEKDLDVIAKVAIEMIDQKSGKNPISFKVETKRADKNFPGTSQELSIQIAGRILRQTSYLSVDVHNQEFTLNVEIRKEAAYIYLDQIMGLGGFPIPMGGKALVMLSGGIDSPVAGFLAMKKGLEIECIHFESSPLTPLESVQKVIDLTEVLARYAPLNQIKLHLVPFRELHEELIKQIPESYIITIMRRMMYRISSIIQDKNNCLAMVTGDSIGQVASQTLESLSCISEVTNLLVIRPLSTYDKLDIMQIARNIETLDISLRPFSDCCSVYLPKNPTIRPESRFAKKFEEKLDYKEMILSCVKDTKTLVVKSYEHFDITSKGFVVSEVL